MRLEEPIIKLEGVTKRYRGGPPALSEVDLRIEKGEFCFLTGPSGAGKSTLLRLLYLAERPTSGEIWIDGVPLGTLRPSQIPHLRRKIGVVFQDFKLLSGKTVFENVAVALEVTGLKRSQIAARVRQVLEGVGLLSKAAQYPPELSGGEQQRVAIARAVVNRPAIVLADEPTGNLDDERTQEVVELLEELNSRGTTVLFATHDTRLFQFTHRRVLRLRDGRLEEGS